MYLWLLLVEMEVNRYTSSQQHFRSLETSKQLIDGVISFLQDLENPQHAADWTQLLQP